MGRHGSVSVDANPSTCGLMEEEVSEQHAELTRQLREAALSLLEERSQQDAAFVFRNCKLRAVFEDMDEYDTPRSSMHVWVWMYCARPMYDMLTQLDHPLRGAIEHALVEVLDPPYAVSTPTIMLRDRIPPMDMRDRLFAIYAKYASPTIPTATPFSGHISSSGLAGGEDANLCFVIMSFSGNPRLRDCYSLAAKPTVV